MFARGLLAGSLCLAEPLLCRDTLSSSSAVLVSGPRRGLLTPLPSPRSENYVIRWASTGVPQDIELLNNLKAVFTVSADPSGAALLLLPAPPLLQSCLRLLPSPLPAEVPPPRPAAFRMHPAPRTGPLRPGRSPCPPASSRIPAPLLAAHFSRAPPARPAPRLLRRPQSWHRDVGTHPGAAPCSLPSQVQGCWGCQGACARISAPSLARSPARRSLAVGRRRHGQHLLTQHFSRCTSRAELTLRTAQAELSICR